MKSRNKLLGYLLIAPTYTLFTLFFAAPLVYSFMLMFYEWNGFSKTKKFVLFKNFAMLLNNDDFINALANTFMYAVATSLLAIAVALVLAVVVQNGILGYDLIKGLYFLPHVVSLVAVSVVWSWIFMPGPSGLVNTFLGYFGIKPQTWLADPNLAMPSLIIIGVWKSLGYNMIIIIAGLLTSPRSIYEAAEIDGAGKLKIFFMITLPLLKPTMFFVAVSSTTASLFQVFDLVKITTGGGPVGSTEMLVTYLYKMGFVEYKLGYASVIAFVLFFIAIAITLVQKMFIEGGGEQ